MTPYARRVIAQSYRSQHPPLTGAPSVRAYQLNGPTLLAWTDTDRPGAYLLAKAVVDRIMANFEFIR